MLSRSEKKDVIISITPMKNPVTVMTCPLTYTQKASKSERDYLMSNFDHIFKDETLSISELSERCTQPHANPTVFGVVKKIYCPVNPQPEIEDRWCDIRCKNDKTKCLFIAERTSKYGPNKGSKYKENICGKLKRRITHWTEQQVYALDIDNDIDALAEWGEQPLTINECLERCSRLELYPSFIYTTFSHTQERPRFRMIFTMDTKTTDIRINDIVINSLQKIFREADKITAPSIHMFYGGNTLKYTNYDYQFSLVHLIHSVSREIDFINDSNKSRNNKRERETFLKICGIDIDNKGYPIIEVINEEDIIIEADITKNDEKQSYREMLETQSFEAEKNLSIEENEKTLKKQIDESGTETKRILLVFVPDSSISETCVKPTEITLQKKHLEIIKTQLIIRKNKITTRIWIGPGFKNRIKKITKEKKLFNARDTQPRRKNIPIDLQSHYALKHCRLLLDFSEGSYKVKHPQLYHLLLSLSFIVGGEDFFFITLYKYPQHYNDVKRSEMLDAQTDLSNYDNPPNCPGACLYKDCYSTCNVPFTLDRSNNKIKININYNMYDTIDESRSKFAIELERSMNAAGKQGSLIRCDAGIGKTEAIINFKKQTGAELILSLPTHILAKDIEHRFINAGITKNLKRIKELPLLEDPKDQAILDYFLGLRTDILAHRFLNDISKKDENIKNYLSELKNLERYKGTLLMTHTRGGMWNSYYYKPLIYDEDPMSSAFTDIGSCTVKDLETLTKLCIASRNLSTLKDSDNLFLTKNAQALIMHMFDFVKNLEPMHMCHNYFNFEGLSYKQLKSIHSVVWTNTQIHTPVFSFLLCDYFVKVIDISYGGVKEVIRFIKKHPIKNPQSTLITTATYNEQFYKTTYPDMLIVDLPATHNAATLYQDHEYSASRTCMRDPAFIEAVRLVLQKWSSRSKLITFKEFMVLLKGEGIDVYRYYTGLYYGNLRGADYLKGYDLVVVGTPHIHPVAYLLLSQYIEAGNHSLKMNNRRVEYKGMSFPIFTFCESEVLQKIQLNYIHSEKDQAINRARLKMTESKDAKILVISNFPTEQAQFLDGYLSKISGYQKNKKNDEEAEC